MEWQAFGRRCLMVGTLVTAVAGCGGGDDGPTPLELTRVPVAELGLVDTGTRVIRSEADWAALWQAHPNPVAPGRTTPAVDFSRHAVAAVFAGPKPRCKTLGIQSATLDAGTVTLRYVITTFGQGTPSSCLGTDPMTPNLADAVLVPASAGEVRFIDDTV